MELYYVNRHNKNGLVLSLIFNEKCVHDLIKQVPVAFDVVVCVDIEAIGSAYDICFQKGEVHHAQNDGHDVLYWQGSLSQVPHHGNAVEQVFRHLKNALATIALVVRLLPSHQPQC